MADIYNELVVKSTLNTILSMIDNYIEIAQKMEKSIVNMNWQEVYAFAYEQNDLNIVLEHHLKKIPAIQKTDSSEVKELKQKLKEKILAFKGYQTINTRLLKDSLLTAKLKNKKIFNNIKNDNYSKELKQEKNLWDEHSLLLNKLA